MKTLIVTLLTSASLASASCTLTLERKKETAKTAFIGNTSVSFKVQQALKTKCRVNYVKLSTNRLIEIERAKYEAKIKRLKSK